VSLWPGDEHDAEEAGPTRMPPFLAVPRTRPAVDRRVTDEEAEPGPDAPRPFVLTSGRVLGSESDIGLETQVSTRLDDDGRYPAPLSRLSRELRAIVTLAVEPTSVAELSARLRLHLDVTKVLVCDLRAAGYLDVHTMDPDRMADPETILRVIDGLRAIS
jgi:hypothetical protein